MTEFQLLKKAAERLSTADLANLTAIHEDRVKEVLDRAVKRCGCDGVLEAWKKVEADPGLWPKTMENRKRLG